MTFDRFVETLASYNYTLTEACMLWVKMRDRDNLDVSALDEALVHKLCVRFQHDVRRPSVGGSIKH